MTAIKEMPVTYNFLNEDGILTSLGEKLIYHLNEHQKQKNDILFKSLLSQFGFFESKAVLDVGCGVGQTLWLLGKGPEEKIGVDIDEISLKIGEKLTRIKKDRILFAKSFADNLPFTDNYFSHLICRVTLNYVLQSKTLKEFSRVLENGGILYLRVEALGFDLNLIKNSHSFRELASRLNDFIYGLCYNLTGKQFENSPFSRVGRTYSTEYRIRKNLQSLNMFIIHLKPFGRTLFFPRAMGIIAQKK